MLTLAFAQIVWAVAFQWDDVTGGDNGIVGIWPTPGRPISAPTTTARPGAVRAPASLFAAARAVLALRLRAARGPRFAAARRGDRHRRAARAWLAFASPAPLRGVAGALFAFSKGSVSPSVIAIGRSMDALVMVLLGGVQTLAGPVVGAAAFTWLHDAADARRPTTGAPALGVTILVLVLAFPAGGIVGAAVARRARGGARERAGASGLHKASAACTRVCDVSFAVDARRDAGADRSQRRRQDRPASTCSTASCGPTPAASRLDGQRHRRPAARARSGALGVGRTFQITAIFALDDGARERADGAAATIAGSWRTCWRAAGAAVRRRGRRRCWRRWHGRTRPTRPCGVLAYGDLKRAGTGDGARQRAAAAADGRAHRRHGAQGAHRADGADAPAGRASAASPCCSPSTTWTWCSATPTASSCSNRGQLIAGGDAAEVRANAGGAGSLSGQPALMLAVAGVIDCTPFTAGAHPARRLAAGQRRARCVVLLGRNGAGKCTTLKSIIGLVRPAAGRSALRRGERIDRLAPLPDRAAGPGLRAGGAAHLYRTDGAGKPRGRPPAAARPACATGRDKLVRAISQPADMRRRAGGRMSRRRAADADHRAHPDGQSGAASCSTSPPRAWRR